MVLHVSPLTPRTAPLQRRRWWGCALLLAAGLGLTGWLPAAEHDDEKWELSLAPYYWAPSLSSEMTYGEYQIGVDEEFLSSPGTFRPNVVGLRFVAAKHDWTLGFGGEGVDAETSVNLPDSTATILEMQHYQFDFSGGRRFYWGEREGLHLMFEPVVGVRYRRAQQYLLASRTNMLASLDHQWVDGVAGIRSQLYLSPKYSVALNGEVDGFLTDRMTYDATGWVKFHWTKEFSLSLGYRYSRFNYEAGSDQRHWAYEGEAHGVIAALELDFFGEGVAADKVWDGFLSVKTDASGRMIDDYTPDPTLSVDDGDREGMSDWLDRMHDYLNEKFDGGVAYADTLMGSNPGKVVEMVYTRKRTRVLTGLKIRVSEQDGVKMEVDPEFKFDAEFPRLERYLKIVVDSREATEAPGTDAFDRERGFNIGVESTGFILKKAKLKLGVRSSIDLFGAITWSPNFRGKRWLIEPTVSGYYRTDRGLGSWMEFVVMYMLKDRYRVSYYPNLEYNEKDDLLKWRQNLAFVYLFEGDEEDMHRAFLTRFAVDGNETEGATRYTWTPIYYNAPLYKKWIYYEIGPEVLWHRKERWEPVPAIRFGVTAHFWGTAER